MPASKPRQKMRNFLPRDLPTTVDACAKIPSQQASPRPKSIRHLASLFMEGDLARAGQPANNRIVLPRRPFSTMASPPISGGPVNIAVVIFFAVILPPNFVDEMPGMPRAIQTDAFRRKNLFTR